MLAPIKALGVVGLGLFSVSIATLLQSILAASFVDAIPPLVSAVVASAGVFLTWKQRRNEREIANVEQSQQGLEAFVNQLQEQQKEDADRLKILRRDYSRIYSALLAYQRGINILITQLERHKIEPEWHPPAIDPLLAEQS